jgi:hypothetical protein
MRRLAILVILIATGPQIRAQAPATYRIAGKVVSSVDNHPLQRATVDILSSSAASPSPEFPRAPSSSGATRPATSPPNTSSTTASTPASPPAQKSTPNRWC